MCISRVLAFTFVLSTGNALSAEIYRCPGASGEPEFRQQPCAGNGTLLRIPVVETVRSTGLRDSERKWLAARGGKTSTRKASTRRPKTSTTPARGQDAHARRCLSKQLALNKVNAELRRGYKPARGERLRRRRREYNDYLSALCS